LLALTLAALGLFGVLSYVVAERRREIGIRMSLGATPARITRSVLGTGLRVVGSGAALGLVGAYVGATSLASLVFGIEPRDTATFVASAGAALAVGLLACYAPARAALQVAPSEALE
jgi:ABC-type antimicrobial peptide transport system permease subunit